MNKTPEIKFIKQSHTQTKLDIERQAIKKARKDATRSDGSVNRILESNLLRERGVKLTPREYVIEITLNGEKHTCEYRQGTAHYTLPTAKEVLHSLKVDASCVIYNDFEQFCAEFGYDTDSRKALATFEACRESLLFLFRAWVSVDEICNIDEE